MPGKIFYRERIKVGKEDRKPRFMVVAVAGADMKIYGQHLRKKELEQIASAVGAELVLLKQEKKGSGEGMGTARGTAGKKRSGPPTANR
jgi:hypothetical protein